MSTASPPSSTLTQTVKSLLAQERDKLFRKPDAIPPSKKTQKDEDKDSLVRSVAAGVGFVSEIKHHRRDKRETKKSKEEEEEEEDEDKGKGKGKVEEMNNAMWDLDDAEDLDKHQESHTHTQTSNAPESKSKSKSKSKDEEKHLAAAFLLRNPPPPPTTSSTSSPRLPLPIIIPQRRPKTRARGFIHAYPPLLDPLGISQSQFLDFITTFNRSLQPNPYLEAINLAGFAGEAMPDPISLLFGIGVEVFSYAAMEGEARYKSNSFLDVMNREFFGPRGLVAMVVVWNGGEGNEGGKKKDEEEQDVIRTVDFEGGHGYGETSGGAGAGAGGMELRQQMKDAVGQRKFNEEVVRKMREQVQERIKSYHGVFEHQTPAPLIFPSLDEAALSGGQPLDAKKKSAMDRAGAWLDDYRDKSAQASFREENPDLPVTSLLPKPEFKSRYADPSHPAASGDLVAFMTGGRWEYYNEEEERKREEKEAKKEAEKQAKREAKEAKETEKMEREVEKKAEKKAKEVEKKEREAEKRAEKKAKEENKAEKKAKKEGKKESKSDVDSERDQHEVNSEETDSKRKSSGLKDLGEQNAKLEPLESKPEASDLKHCGDQQRKAHEDETKSEQSDPKRKSTDSKKSTKKQKQASGLSSLLQEDIIYLLIVNAPRPQEGSMSQVNV